MTVPLIRSDSDWPPAPFEVLRPRHGLVPVVAHIPHDSSLIPWNVREEFVVDDDELRIELIRLTDWHTDDLFAPLADRGVSRFVNRLSRFVFDPERFLANELEPTAAIGQGVVYTRGTGGQRLREADPELRARRIEALYRPYHAALDQVVADSLHEFGRCTLIDCHSFPSVPLPSELDQTPDRPDVCIGTDAAHTPAELAADVERAFSAEGFSTKRDSPFSGTFVPGGSYGQDRSVRSVMIEVRRGLYIDEATAERRADYDAVRSAIERAIVASVLPRA